MEVKLDKRYPVDASPGQAWAVLRDVRAVAGCMPGAAITEQTDDTHFKGQVKVKVGPATAAFGGTIEVLALEPDAQRLHLLGKGADKSGSTASMDLNASVEPAGDGTSVLVGVASVVVNGKFAQFGGRMMVQVSDMILAQFADNFRAAAAQQPADGPPGDDGGATAAATGAGVPESASQSRSQSQSQSATPAPAPAPARELNALAILWALIRNWFAGLFGRGG